MAASPQHITLTGGVVETVTFDYAFEFLEVLNVDGAAAVYFTLDGTTPAVGATGTEVLPAAISSLATFRSTFQTPNGGRIVKLISSGTPQISVAGRHRKTRST